MNGILKFIFLVSLVLPIYSYLIYPLLLLIVTGIKQIKEDLDFAWNRRSRRNNNICQQEENVSIIIAAYNEEKVIRSRLENCLNLDYPMDHLEVIVGSDGSDDKTDDIVKEFANRGVKLYSFKERKGKTSILNETIPKAIGEIAILSDANTVFGKDCVKKLVRHFQNPKVGAVCGALRFERAEDINTSEDIYWKYENMLKFFENRLGSVLGANGGIYALRKVLFCQIPKDTIVDDFVIPMNIKGEGYNVVYDPEAIAYEDACKNVGAEFNRRVRIGAGDFQSIRLTKKLLNPLRGWIAFTFWSHKLIRWITPICLLFLFITNVLLSGGFLYKIFLTVQIIFYTIAVLGWFLSKRSTRLKILRSPLYFVTINAALFLGFVRFLTNTQKVTWKRTKRE